MEDVERMDNKQDFGPDSANLKRKFDEYVNGDDRLSPEPSKTNKLDNEIGNFPECSSQALPDHLRFDLDIVVVGINPGIASATVGHHYAGKNNHFWKLLHASGLTSEQLNCESDVQLPKIGIGLTNMVDRTTRSSSDLSLNELREGAERLRQKLLKFRPKIVCFNGKEIYRIFSGEKQFTLGKQPEPMAGTSDVLLFVVPSSSARVAAYPTVASKLPFYEYLRKLRDFVTGKLDSIDDNENLFGDDHSVVCCASPELIGELGTEYEDEDYEGTSVGLNGDSSEEHSRLNGDGSINGPVTTQQQLQQLPQTILSTATDNGDQFLKNSDDEKSQQERPSGASSGAADLASINPTISSAAGAFDKMLHEALQQSQQKQNPAANSFVSTVDAVAAAGRSENNNAPKTAEEANAQALHHQQQLIEQHIAESVAAVVQRCKDGTQELPDHYIRPSTPPAVKAAPPPPPPPQQPPPAHQQHRQQAHHHHQQQQQHAQQQRQRQHHHQQQQQQQQTQQAQQQQPQQNLVQQQLAQQTAANQLLSSLYGAVNQQQQQQQQQPSAASQRQTQSSTQGVSTTNPSAGQTGQSALDYLNYFNQPAVAGYDQLQRAMQQVAGVAGNYQQQGWPGQLYDALAGAAPFYQAGAAGSNQQNQQQPQQQQQQQGQQTAFRPTGTQQQSTTAAANPSDYYNNFFSAGANYTGQNQNF